MACVCAENCVKLGVHQMKHVATGVRTCGFRTRTFGSQWGFNVRGGEHANVDGNPHPKLLDEQQLFGEDLASRLGAPCSQGCIECAPSMWSSVFANLETSKTHSWSVWGFFVYNLRQDGKKQQWWTIGERYGAPLLFKASCLVGCSWRQLAMLGDTRIACAFATVTAHSEQNQQHDCYWVTVFIRGTWSVVDSSQV
eukprot:937436-Amphidinium_carterae.1